MSRFRHPSTVRLTSVLLLTTLGAACQDSPTLPASAPHPTPSIARLDQGQHLGEVPFSCALGRSTTSTLNGWETRRLTIFVPRGELDQAGRIVRYEYRRSSIEGRLVAAAFCLVPYTEGALRRVDRTLGVKENGGADQLRARQQMVTTQGCVTSPDSACVVDPIIVPPPPRDRTTEVQCGAMDPDCGNSGGEDDWGDGGWGGGGDGTDDPDDEDGAGAFALCVALKLGVSGWSSIGTTMVSAYVAWDARQSSRNAYDKWAKYRQDVEAGLARYDMYINDLYYTAWKNAEHQEMVLYGLAATSATWTSVELFSAAVACSPYALAPV